MFERELTDIADRISATLSALGVPNAGAVKWQSTPFAGQWGMGTNICFQAAAAEARSGKTVNVPARAQELAQRVAEMHHGNITAANHPEGGAVFRITIPRN